MAKSTQKIRIIIKSYDHHLTNDASKNIIDALERTGATVSGPIPLPTKIKKFSVLRSTNVNKTSFEQFEIRTHKRIIDIAESNSDTIPTLQQLQMPSGLDIEIKMLAE
jgi:small subunit ribosomal protein S10